MTKTKAPFKVLFSNDTFNLLNCTSPYHQKGETFRPEMLEAAVDETVGTGVDVHMLQPGFGWVPMWQSKRNPPAEHYAWLSKKYGVGPDGYGRYLLGGGDLIDLFVKRCRTRSLTPFVSYRLNDTHGKEFVDSTPKEAFPGLSGHAIDQFYAEHSQYRISADLEDRDGRGHNWAIPEVRNHKFAFIEEICEAYDIDGLELDFMRDASLFRLNETTSEQRAEIVTAFVTRVRELLDRTAKPGQHRWLCVRIPCFRGTHDSIGIGLPSIVEAGVEMINLASSYFTEQQTDLREIRKTVPDVALYLEITHCTSIQRITTPGYDVNANRYTTDEQATTAAHLGFARGADGVSAFNFVYYREHGAPQRGPFNEPPFHLFEQLADPAGLMRRPQHYIFGTIENPPLLDRPIPRPVQPGETVVFTLDLAPPAGGWKREGKLRIQCHEPLGTSQWKARLNGAELRLNADVSEPYPSPYSTLLGTPEQHRAWTVPPGAPRDGMNSVQITMEEGQPADIIFLDLAAA